MLMLIAKKEKCSCVPAKKSRATATGARTGARWLHRVLERHASYFTHEAREGRPTLLEDHIDELLPPCDVLPPVYELV